MAVGILVREVIDRAPGLQAAEVDQVDTAARLQDAEPVGEALRRVPQVLEAMARVHEVEAFVLHALHVLRIAILDVPGPDGSHAGEKLVVYAERVGCPADIDAFADEVTRREIRVAQTPHDRLAAFLHRAVRVIPFLVGGSLAQSVPFEEQAPEQSSR